MDQSHHARESIIADSLGALTLHAPAFRPCTPEQQLLGQPNARPCFTLFFKFPPEIRLLVYEQYFSSADDVDTHITPKSHKEQGDGAVALLFTCHQTYREALPIFYDTATLTIDLNPRYHFNDKDYAFWLDNHMDADSTFKGDREQLLKFRHVHLTLPKPPIQVLELSRMSFLIESTWWQDVAPIFSTTSAFFPNLTLAVNVGDITSTFPAAHSFARFVDRPYFYADGNGWRGCKSRSNKTAAELEAGAYGVRFRQRPLSYRELQARAHLINWVGNKSRALGRVLTVENSDRSRAEEVHSDKLPDLVKSARAVAGEGKEKDVWLVIGAKEKRD